MWSVVLPHQRKEQSREVERSSVLAPEKGSFFQQTPARFPPCQGNPGGKIEAKTPESFAEIAFGHIFLLQISIVELTPAPILPIIILLWPNFGVAC